MNYPAWYLPSMGGGLLIAIIAIAHVVIAHLAVGGGLFLVLTERKAIKTGNTVLFDYVKRHTWFFLLLTMVFGGVSGVGIWFIISLVNPAATSMLIHTFVFGWAIEWVFFISEIIALIIYYYCFDRMPHRNHIIIGWLYFIFAWLSLFVINGILTFMLTPGAWMETGSFWDGFFNPSFLPSLLFRTAIAIIFAGVFGLVTGSFMKDRDTRILIFRYCARWMYIPLAVLAFTGIYYTAVISRESFLNLFHFNRASEPFITILIVSTIVLFGLGLFTLFRLPALLQRLGAFILVVICFSWMAGFEYLREMARKPYVLYGHMYSTGIAPDDMQTIRSKGFLETAKWYIQESSSMTTLEKGSEIFRLQCMACHTAEGYNAVKPLSSKLTERGIEALLTGMGKVHTYMPPFAGNSDEKRALAAYIYHTIQGKDDVKASRQKPGNGQTEMPEFDMGKSDYVILAWNDLGMHCISDNEKYFSFLPPGNTLNAQLIRRGAKPEVIDKGALLTYRVQEGHENPENHSMFWKYDKQIFGADLPAGTGLAGKRVHDTMDIHGTVYAAELIPVMPYRDDRKYNPYPVFTVEAHDKTSSELLARTKVVAPTSTEMGCRNCHEGGWRWNNVSGVADLTAANILAAHDRYEETTLLEDAEAGNPVLCQSCHADPAVGAPGKSTVLNFSAAVHGFHANYLSGMDQEACNMCHPSRKNGNTSCMRGRHSQAGLNCTSCHGRLEDHALSLLAGQANIPASARLAEHLEPVFAGSKENVVPREPWLMEPDCRSCHTNFNIREDGYKGTAYNLWVPGFSALYRNRTDTHGVMCSACHGSTHAIYGAVNMYEKHRDNLQPIQYQGIAGTIGTRDMCMVCHIKPMEVNGHHRNMVNREHLATIVE